MNPGWSRYRAARGLSVAVAGLLTGHMLVYRIIAPNALQRAMLLAGTGHAYLPSALVLGATLAAVAGAATFLRAFRPGPAFRRGRASRPGRASRRGASAPQPGQATSLARALLVPALAQAGAFVLLETLERSLAGAPLGGLLGPLLPAGVLLQLVVGALGGLVLVGLDRAGALAGRLLAGRRPAHRRSSGPRHLPTPPGRAAWRDLGGAFGIRGPPLPRPLTG